MKQYLLFFLVIVINERNVVGQIEAAWRTADIALIDSVSRIDKGDPKAVADFFLHRNKPFRMDESLGFGWSSVKTGIGAGYISINVTLYYYRDTVKTYILESWLPNENEIVDEYKGYFSKLLPIKGNGVYQYIYGSGNIMSPVREYDFGKMQSKIPTNLLKYMAPTSGTTYGYRGGIASSILENRKMFNQIERQLTINDLLVLMYSINPASRLSAIECYLRRVKHGDIPANVTKWIQKVYEEPPTIETMKGCIEERESSRQLVAEFLKQDPRKL